MNKEEYIIQIDDVKVSVSKEMYNIIVPLGKIINKLQQENEQLKAIINKIKELMEQNKCVEEIYRNIDDYLSKNKGCDNYV